MIKIFCFFYVLFSMTVALAGEDRESVANCHCFRDRVFDSQDRFAADEYLLTTNFNSFIAASFRVSKSQVVMMKMKGGVDPGDLLIALYVARGCHVQLNNLLAVLDTGGTWQEISESKGVRKEEDCNEVLGVVGDADGNREEAIRGVTDQLVKEYFGVSVQDVSRLRARGATGREIVFLLNLERHGITRKSATEILALHRQQNMSWGEIAQLDGLSPEETGKLFLQEVSSAETLR